MMEDDPDFGYYCETDDDGVTPVTKTLIQCLEILHSRTFILASLFPEDGSISFFGGLFFESPDNFSGPKSLLSNSTPLVLKS